MLTLSLYFLIGVFFWITGFYILYRAKDVAFYFLAAHFFIMGFGVITRTILFGKLIYDLPHIYGVLMPFQFLYGPFYYFFLLWLFKKKSQFQLIDLLHLFPFLFNIIDFIPFFVLPGSSKIELFESKSSLSILGIDLESYDLLKVLSYVFYLIIGAIFYVQYVSSAKIENKRKTLFIHSWIKLDFILKLIAVVSNVVIGLISKNESFTISYYFYSADVFLNVFIVFKWPNLLNGIQFSYIVSKVTPIKKTWILLTRIFWNIFYKRSKLDENIVAVNSILSFKSSFKERNFTALKLANLLHVEERELQKLCYYKFNCNVDMLINFVRLTILSDLISKSNKPLLKNLIYESGFDSLIRFEKTLRLSQKIEFSKALPIRPENYLKIKGLYKQQVNNSFF